MPEWEDLYIFYSYTIINLLTTGTANYFNEHEVTFSPEQKQTFQEFSAIPYSIDFDGDSQQEWLVEVDYPKYDGLRTWLPLNLNPDGTYTIIPNDLPIMFVDAPNDTVTELNVSHDVNGNWVKDIVLGSLSYFAGRMSGDVTVYSWDGNRIYELDTMRLPGVVPEYAEVYSSWFEIADYDGNGVKDLRVIEPRFLWFDCSWETVYTYSWKGEQQFISIKDEDIPLKPNCYIAKALSSSSPKEQVKYYQAALSNLHADSSSDLETWLHLQLSVAYSAQGLDFNAQQELDSLLAEDNAGKFHALINEAVQEVGYEPIAICQSLYNTACNLNSGSKLNTDIDDDLGFFGGYPIFYEINPERVCPYWDLFMNRISTISIPGNGEPVESLNNLGYSLKLPYSQNLDIDPQDELVGILEIERPLVMVLDHLNNEWKMYPIDYIDRLPISLEVNIYDSDDNGESEILVMAKMENHEYSECEPGTNTYHLIMGASAQDGYTPLKQRTFSCNFKPPVDLSTDQGKVQFIEYVTECNRCNLVNDQDITEEITLPDWVMMDGFFHQQENVDVFDYVQNIQQSVLSDGDIENTRSKIVELLEYLPDDVASAVLLSNQLHYLLGLSYELENKPEEAVRVYLELISEIPDTPWSWLAWARLSPNPILTEGK
jgi:hypothetical protein